MKKAHLRLGIIGNPNVGKTSIFNQLTGLNRKVGNYPGITVDKKQGEFTFEETKVTLIDLPGTYSIYPSSLDEKVVFEQVLAPSKSSLDGVIVVAEPENLKRNLFLFSQIQDLEIPTLLVINMADKLNKDGIQIDVPKLEKKLETKVIMTSSRRSTGIDELKSAMVSELKVADNSILSYVELKKDEQVILRGKDYANHIVELIEKTKTEESIKYKSIQKRETVRRYSAIRTILEGCYTLTSLKSRVWSNKLDKILMHKVWGYLIFIIILGLIFQGVFSWSGYLMDGIDSAMGSLSEWFSTTVDPGMLNNLISQGVIPGIQGVVIFVPQIAYLFLCITLLEQSGYMSRVVVLMDKVLRPFGLSGKSVVPLISGTACAIPAVMATRTIEDSKERLATILVTPFTTCSARLPVYSILISLVIPDTNLGPFNIQGLMLLSLYLLGFLSALIAAWFLKVIWKKKGSSFFIAEIPNYQLPLLKNTLITVWDKTKEFVFQAGKIILAISIILWFLGSFGPGDEFENAETLVAEAQPELISDSVALEDAIASYRLEHSYLGHIGKGIEPIIKPLGYDWKIGIALVSSFAAREVFVGALATIYSIGSAEEEEDKVIARMQNEVNPETGKPVFTLAVGVSLLLFYAFAMQCMSTLAIVKRETHSWKWPAIQLIGMSGVAYLSALIAYHVLK